VDHPTSGPVQTSDVADCLMAVTWMLLSDANGFAMGHALGDLPPHGVPGVSDVHRRLGTFYGARGVGAPRGDRYDPSRGSRRGRGGLGRRR
jgi:hypothetical protein